MLCDTRTEYDWKELKIDNLPPDIFQDNVYEFGYYNESQKNNGICQESSSLKTWFNRWWGGDCSHLKYYYRKSQPKQPTHEEIMSKWWLNSDDIWMRIYGYSVLSKQYLCSIGEGEPHPTKAYFIGRESADIPPEK